MTDVDEPEVHHQPALPNMELPDYHGRKPASMRTTLTGAGTRVTSSHTIGDRLVLVIEARVKSAAHEETDDGLVYVEKLKVLDLFELDRDQGSRLISTVRSLYRTGEDAVKGRRPVPGLGEVGYTDASGVVLTEKEVAALRGDPIRTILSPELQPAVVVYDDGARDLWPDDYAKDTPRPAVGDRFATDSGEATVVRLLHHETGEQLEGPPAEEPTAVDGEPEVPADPFPSNVTQLRPPGGELPELPGDAYSGDLGDSVADEWDTPVDPATVERISKAEAEETARIEATLPTAADFAFVDRDLSELAAALAEQTDLLALRRIRRAEEEGRGRALKPRKGALELIDRRINTATRDAAEEASS